ncbi:hypothetical protein [Fibrobacter sp.]|uniref:hypothetical protein n=1 Tax=Fibrobacter sp. TaxID=35828 RepID=UPI00386F6842
MNTNVDFNLWFSDEKSEGARCKTVLDEEPAPRLPSIPVSPTRLLVSYKFSVKFISEKTSAWSIDNLGNYIKDIDFKPKEILFSFYNTKDFQFYRLANKFGCAGKILVDITSYDGVTPVETTRYRVCISERPWRSTLSAADEESYSLTYVKGTILALGEPDEIKWRDKTDLSCDDDRLGW